VIKNNIGFMLINIENDQHHDSMLQNIRKLIDANPYKNIVIFNSICNKITTYNIPILHLSHAKFFEGDLWLFDLTSVIISKNFTNLNKKILYCNDMPWLKNRTNIYNEWLKIYDSDLDFVTTNQYLYDIYSICWKKPLDIMENFDYEKIQHIV
jgi:hypothetical protein